MPLLSLILTIIANILLRIFENLKLVICITIYNTKEQLKSSVNQLSNMHWSVVNLSDTMTWVNDGACSFKGMIRENLSTVCFTFPFKYYEEEPHEWTNHPCP